MNTRQIFNYIEMNQAYQSFRKVREMDDRDFYKEMSQEKREVFYNRWIKPTIKEHGSHQNPLERLKNAEYFRFYRQLSFKFPDIWKLQWSDGTMTVPFDYNGAIELQINASFDFDKLKLFIRVESNFRLSRVLKPFKERNLKMEVQSGYYGDSVNIWTRDVEWSKEGIIQKVKEILDRFFYHKESIWFTFQYLNQYTKKEMIQAYKKEGYAEWRDEPTENEINNMMEKGWLNRLKKHKNIYINEMVAASLNDRMFAKIFNQYEWKKQRRNVFKYDYSWFHDFDGDIDELENEYHNSLEENVIYI